MSERENRIRNLIEWLRGHEAGITAGASQVADDVESLLTEHRTPGPATATKRLLRLFEKISTYDKEQLGHTIDVPADRMRDDINAFLAEWE